MADKRVVWILGAGFSNLGEHFEKVHLAALQLMAAECCAFLEDANLDYERWRPYKRWARDLTAKDTVLTFNYDRVPDLLEGGQSLLHVPDPCSVEYDETTQRCSSSQPKSRGGAQTAWMRKLAQSRERCRARNRPRAKSESSRGAQLRQAA